MKQPLKLLLAVLAAGSVTALAFLGWTAKAKSDSRVAYETGIGSSIVKNPFKGYEKIVCTISASESGNTTSLIKGKWRDSASSVPPTDDTLLTLDISPLTKH